MQQSPMAAYVPLLVYMSLALAVPVVISLLAGLLGPKRPSQAKLEPYESGYATAPMIGRVPVKFYLVAMLFVVFDVEAASFYPWATQLRNLGAFALYEMLAFVAVLGIGYAYVWKKGGFSWR